MKLTIKKNTIKRKLRDQVMGEGIYFESGEYALIRVASNKLAGTILIISKADITIVTTSIDEEAEGIPVILKEIILQSKEY